MKPWCVYALIDPRSGAVRYVGWTTNLERRIRAHLKPSRLTGSQRRDRWLALLVRDGLRPTVEVLQRGSEDEWATAERYWIAYYRERGADLTNHTDGGQGTPGRRHSEEMKAKWSALRKGIFPAAAMAAYVAKYKGKPRDPEMIEKLAAGLRGKKKSPEHRKKLADALRGRTHSPERRAAVSVGMRGKKRGPMSEIAKRHLSEAKKGKPNPGKRAWWASLTPEQRSDIARRGNATRKARARGDCK